jgi:thioredoxin reductase (NADPH)
MANVAVIGDGPAGLSAALFLAKNDQQVTVYGTDGSAMHYAHLHNYLGVDDRHGSDFQRQARAQVATHGARFVEENVTELTLDGDGFTVRTDGDRTDHADYLVLAAAKSGGRLAQQLGIEVGADGVDVDRQQRTSVDRVTRRAGWSARTAARRSSRPAPVPSPRSTSWRARPART